MAGSGVEDILDAVVALVESEGFDGVSLRDVARMARVSLATVYKTFPSREELLLAAVERWMYEQVYRHLERPIEGASFNDAFLTLLRRVFEPWERHPQLLDAFLRAQLLPGGSRLYEQGLELTAPFTASMGDHLDPEYVSDVGMVVTNVVYGLLASYAGGRVKLSEILPSLERTLARLTEAHPEALKPPTKGEP
jgi:TetR/AcrR family transcriptional regulator, cholesterol catabolism regulator